MKKTVLISFVFLFTNLAFAGKIVPIYCYDENKDYTFQALFGTNSVILNFGADVNITSRRGAKSLVRFEKGDFVELEMSSLKALMMETPREYFGQFQPTNINDRTVQLRFGIAPNPEGTFKALLSAALVTGKRERLNTIEFVCAKTR